MFVGIIETLLNGLGYIRVSACAASLTTRSAVSVEEVSCVIMVYLGNNIVRNLGYGFNIFYKLLGL